MYTHTHTHAHTHARTHARRRTHTHTHTQPRFRILPTHQLVVDLDSTTEESETGLMHALLTCGGESLWAADTRAAQRSADRAGVLVVIIVGHDEAAPRVRVCVSGLRLLDKTG